MELELNFEDGLVVVVEGERVGRSLVWVIMPMGVRMWRYI